MKVLLFRFWNGVSDVVAWEGGAPPGSMQGTAQNCFDKIIDRLGQLKIM